MALAKVILDYLEDQLKAVCSETTFLYGWILTNIKKVAETEKEATLWRQCFVSLTVTNPGLRNMPFSRAFNMHPQTSRKFKKGQRFQDMHRKTVEQFAADYIAEVSRLVALADAANYSDWVIAGGDGLLVLFLEAGDYLPPLGQAVRLAMINAEKTGTLPSGIVQLFFEIVKAAAGEHSEAEEEARQQRIASVLQGRFQGLRKLIEAGTTEGAIDVLGILEREVITLLRLTFSLQEKVNTSQAWKSRKTGEKKAA